MQFNARHLQPRNFKKLLHIFTSSKSIYICFCSFFLVLYIIYNFVRKPRFEINFITKKFHYIYLYLFLPQERNYTTIIKKYIKTALRTRKICFTNLIKIHVLEIKKDAKLLFLNWNMIILTAVNNPIINNE